MLKTGPEPINRREGSGFGPATRGATSAIELQFVHCNTTGSWLCDKYAYALQQGGAVVELVGLRFDGGRNEISGLCDNLVPQRTFGFHYQFRAPVRLLKAFERSWVDARKLLERGRLFRYLRRSRATHFVATDPAALDLCVSARRRGHGKIFYLPFEHYRDLIGANERRKRQFIRLERQNLPFVTAALFCGDTILDDYVSAYGCADRSHVIYNGWPLALTGKRKALRPAVGIGQDRIVILYQGAIDATRGVTDVIAALAGLAKETCFVLVGYGHGTQEAKNCAQEAGVGDRVFFLPPVPQRELMDFTADADIGVIPLRDLRSHYFACPGKLFEFIGAGLPLVVSALPDLKRFVSTYGLGEVFRSGDPRDLARALGALANSAEYRNQCARHSRALHQDSVCWEVQSRKMCEIVLR